MPCYPEKAEVLCSMFKEPRRHTDNAKFADPIMKKRRDNLYALSDLRASAFNFACLGGFHLETVI